MRTVVQILQKVRDRVQILQEVRIVVQILQKEESWSLDLAKGES